MLELIAAMKWIIKKKKLKLKFDWTVTKFVLIALYC